MKKVIGANRAALAEFYEDLSDALAAGKRKLRLLEEQGDHSGVSKEQERLRKLQEQMDDILSIPKP